MKQILFLLLVLPLLVLSQEAVETQFIKSSALQVDQLISIDNFGAVYYIENNTLYKEFGEQKLNYSNFQLHSITHVNTFNPLKLSLFYKQFNTIIILDNRLAEIFKIDFNTIQPYKNVSLISAGFDNTLWIFNQDLNQLELFDYKTGKSRFSTVPVASKALDMTSNYNYCWLLTEKYIYQYNYFGGLLSKIPNDGFIKLTQYNGELLLQKENTLFLLKENEDTPKALKLPDLLIKQFFVTNETLYLYDSQKVHEFKLTAN